VAIEGLNDITNGTAGAVPLSQSRLDERRGDNDRIGRYQGCHRDAGPGEWAKVQEDGLAVLDLGERNGDLFGAVTSWMGVRVKVGRRALP
jgi:hypothetical protein